MLVFLSCSGDRSKAVAETFSKWIAQVIQAVEPWISAEIEKGARWNEEVAAKLEESRVGIICLTKENPNERWILFESGAIAKTKDARVCTLLLDIDPSDVQQPLGGFQHTTARDKNDVRKLLETINTAVAKCGKKALSESVLDRVFETNWPELLAAFERIASQQPPSGAGKRDPQEILEEILEIVRGQERRIGQLQKTQLGGGRALELSGAGVLSGAVARYLVENYPAGVLSSHFAEYLAKHAEDETNPIYEGVIAETFAEHEKKKRRASRDADKG